MIAYLTLFAYNLCIVALAATSITAGLTALFLQTDDHEDRVNTAYIAGIFAAVCLCLLMIRPALEEALL